jgi:asparagine synthase (glutamine-hydrolysing)
MFAFALWDRAAKRLFVARDRFGEKPLYYAALPEGGVAFASEAKALFGHPGISPDVDISEVDRFICGAPLIAGERTLFRNVHRLPASNAVLIDSAGRETRRWRYWTPDYTKIDHGIKLADAAEEFGARLRKSLLQRLRSDVQVGACLSGGVDSSILVGMLSRMRSEKGDVLRNTYSARFDDDPTVSEGDYIDLVLKHTGANGRAVSPRAEEFVRDARRLYWHQEIPFLSPSIYLEWRVLKLARETGTTVMIDGQGADELLGGYQHYFAMRQQDLLSSGRILRLVNETRAFDRRLKDAASQYVDGQRRFDPNVALGPKELLSRAWRHHSARLKDRLRGRSVGPAAPDGRPGVPEHHGLFRRQLAAGLLYDMLSKQLHSADRSAMAFGVETRFPYIDYELVDWTISLPDEVMIADGWQKLVLRHAAGDTVPKEVKWRADKVGFAAPQDVWLREDGANWMAERLFDSGLSRLPSYSAPRARQLWDEHRSGRTDRSWELFRWASAAEWLSIADGDEWRNPRFNTVDRAREAQIAEPASP